MYVITRADEGPIAISSRIEKALALVRQTFRAERGWRKAEDEVNTWYNAAGIAVEIRKFIVDDGDRNAP